MCNMNITSAVIIAVSVGMAAFICIPMSMYCLERFSGNIVHRPQDRLSHLENTQQIEI